MHPGSSTHIEFRGKSLKMGMSLWLSVMRYDSRISGPLSQICKQLFAWGDDLFNTLVSLCMKTSPREDSGDHTEYVADIHSLKALYPNGDIISAYTRATVGHNRRKNIPEFNARCSWSDPLQLYLVIKILKCLTTSLSLSMIAAQLSPQDSIVLNLQQLKCQW